MVDPPRESSAESEPHRLPTPPEPFSTTTPKPASKGGLMAVAASATGALLLLGGIFLVTRGLGFGTRELSLDTQPSGAVLRVDGKEMGLAPMIKAKVPKKAERLEVSLPGYETKTIALLPNDRDLQVIVLKPLAGTAEGVEQPSDDPEIEAMRRKVKALEAQNLKEAERLRKLKEQGSKPAPIPSAPASSGQPTPAPQPVAPVQSPATAPTPAPQPTPTKATAESSLATGPSVLRKVTPQYPSRARLARFESSKIHKVLLRVFVDESGKPGKIQVVEGVPGPYGFDEAARDAALQCIYLPGSRGGRPASGWVEFAFVFQPLTR